MKLVLVLAVCACTLGLAAPAIAAGWQAEMVEDEGGPTMQAWIDVGTGDTPDDLRLACADTGQVGLRYSFDAGEGAPEPGDKPALFAIAVDAESLSLPMQLEEMDGAYAAYLPADAPLLRMLQSGTTVTMSAPAAMAHTTVFPLSGSAKAIGRLLATCN